MREKGKVSAFPFSNILAQLVLFLSGSGLIRFGTVLIETLLFSMNGGIKDADRS